MEYRLKDCLEKVIDNRGKNPKYFDKEKYPVIDNVFIKNNYYINDKIVNRYINQETYDNFLRGYVEENMPIMTLVGSGIGNVGLIKNENVAIVQNTIGFKTKENLDPKYLYYWFLTKQDELQSFNRGSGQPSIKKTDVENMEIDLPDIAIQKKIVYILEKLDDKIYLNDQINYNLYNQAVAIYNNSFQYNNNGDCSIGNYIIPKRGKNLLSKDAVLGDIPVVAGGLEPATYHNVSNTKAPVITISASGANAGYINLWNVPVWSSDSSYIDKDITNNVYFWYVTLKTRQKEIFDAQTGSAQPHIYPQHIAELPINKLNEDEILQYEKKVTPFFDMIGNNKKENKYLEQLRDTLLPKLMNGEIDLDKIEI